MPSFFFLSRRRIMVHFTKENLDTLVAFYLDAHKSGNAIPVFAPTAALPDILKEHIEQALHQCCLEQRPFEYNGQQLTPSTITANGGALLCAYVNAQGNHALLLAPMCEQIRQDENLQMFVKEISGMKAAPQWEYQRKAIQLCAWKYAAITLMSSVLADKNELLQQNRDLCDLNRSSNDRIIALEKEVEELTLDKRILQEDVHSLKSKNKTLHVKLVEVHAYVDEKEEELQQAKENALEANFVEHVKSMDSHVKAVTVDTNRFECTFKSKGTPPVESKQAAKTPFSARASRVPKTPIHRPRPSSAYSRPSSPDFDEDIM